MTFILSSEVKKLISPQESADVEFYINTSLFNVSFIFYRRFNCYIVNICLSENHWGLHLAHLLALFSDHFIKNYVRYWCIRHFDNSFEKEMQHHVYWSVMLLFTRLRKKNIDRYTGWHSEKTINKDGARVLEREVTLINGTWNSSELDTHVFTDTFHCCESMRLSVKDFK